ncbi:hypothetical protein BJX96DRAFT_169654 [Aspergillus floccosus]
MSVPSPASISSSPRDAAPALQILDNLIRLRAADATQVPILAYPYHERALSYAYFSGRDLDAMIDRTAQELMERGIQPNLGPVNLRPRTANIQKSHTAVILHSSGSTGLSKPLYLSYNALVSQAMYTRNTAFMWDVSRPLTANSLTQALSIAKPELRSCKLVTYGGAPCPDELGDLLVANGVRLGGLLGSYVGGSVYECVYLPGHPSLSASNADDGSYHSGDLFVQHPTHPKRWKYVARGDDRVTLTNGEKVLPLPIEGTIRRHPLVDKAVVVGVQKAEPGLLIFRAQAAKDTPAEEILDHIWSTVEEANARAEQFSRISRAMVTVLPEGTVCPRTDKRSIIRTQVYADFKDDINRMYSRSDDRAGALQLSVDDTAAHLLTLCQKELHVPISTVHDNLYSYGFADAATVLQNLVYDAGNISRLAEAIYAIQHGQHTQHKDERALARDWIERYSSFPGTPGLGAPSQEKAVILTGATGSIGAYLLQTLLADKTISTVHCLTRQSDPHDALFANLRRKQIPIPPAWAERIVALQSDLEQNDLGVSDKLPVNFTLPLSSFEPHIKGLHNLINFSMSVDAPVPAVLLFCSSVSTALASSSSEIEETPIGLDCALDMGYSRSKVVGEQIIDRARQAGAHAYSVRIGQNDSEAIPLIIRSALTLRALPDLDLSCSWLPVDQLATYLQEVANACLKRREAGPSLNRHENTVYNLLRLLEESKARGEETANPAVKLADHYRTTYGQGSESAQKRFLTRNVERDSQTLKGKSARIIKDGILGRNVSGTLTETSRGRNQP